MGRKIPKERKRLLTFILITFFYLGFVLINAVFSAGIIYIVLLTISYLILINWDKIPKKRKNVKLFGFQDDWMKDLGIGISAGIGVLILKTFSPFAFLSWATPRLPLANLPFATANQWLIIAGAAPTVEEIFFTVLLFAVLYQVLGLSFFTSALIKSISFGAFHIKSYAGEIALSPILSVSGAFITAMLVAFLIQYLVKWRGSATTGMGTHGALNVGALLGRFVIVG